MPGLTLLDKPAHWLAGDGPEADIAVKCQCRLVRNLADYLFTERCREDERRAVEERVRGVLDPLDLLATGSYWSLDGLDDAEVVFLAERRLLTASMLDHEGAQGVYIADDQSLSIAVNDENHVTIRGLASGSNFQEVWARVNLIDDTLAGALDFSFDERLGYLSADIGEVGTALKVSVILHLPVLTMTNRISESEELAGEKRHRLHRLYRSKGNVPGDLYRLSNGSTLGRSEEETLFHIKHLTAELIARERKAREHLLCDAPLQLEDRVGRAWGLAHGVRLLAFEEALEILSSLRLGVAENLLDGTRLDVLNDLFMASHDAHIEMKCGHGCDELTLSTERADLFRARFA